MTRQPTLFLSHGGGPCFWLEGPGPFGAAAYADLRLYLAGLIGQLPSLPKAILVISAHWEEALPTISTAPSPPMLFDYYGFPPHTYRLSYPAPGAPTLARQAAELCRRAGIAVALDQTRGFDHGVFVPMLIIDPTARIPVVMLSLRQDLDPAAHLALGAALAPLREEGVLILGSGNSYHNLRGFGSDDGGTAQDFDDWLADIVGMPAPERRAALENWRRAPGAAQCHPREEHLLPLMIAAGAAETDPGRISLRYRMAGKPVSCVAFEATA